MTADESMFRHTPPPALTDYGALAHYNAERARGIMHRPEWDARMAEIQAAFNAERLSGFVRVERRRWWQR